LRFERQFAEHSESRKQGNDGKGSLHRQDVPWSGRKFIEYREMDPDLERVEAPFIDASTAGC
jgi:hypothetical protein